MGEQVSGGGNGLNVIIALQSIDFDVELAVQIVRADELGCSVDADACGHGDLDVRSVCIIDGGCVFSVFVCLKLGVKRRVSGVREDMVLELTGG